MSLEVPGMFSTFISVGLFFSLTIEFLEQLNVFSTFQSATLFFIGFIFQLFDLKSLWPRVLAWAVRLRPRLTTKKVILLDYEWKRGEAVPQGSNSPFEVPALLQNVPFTLAHTHTHTHTLKIGAFKSLIEPPLSES